MFHINTQSYSLKKKSVWI